MNAQKKKKNENLWEKKPFQWSKMNKNEYATEKNATPGQMRDAWIKEYCLVEYLQNWPNFPDVEAASVLAMILLQTNQLQQIIH